MGQLRIGKFSLDLRFPILLLLLLTSVLLAVFNQPVAAIGGQERLAYYGNWDIYGNNYFLRDVDRTGAASQLTTLVYSFENINPTTLQCFQTSHAVDTSDSNPNGGDGGGDAWGDFQRPFSATESVNGIADNPTQPLRGSFNQVKELKAKHPNLKVILSIGGWSFSKYFSDAAATPASRQAFVSSCVDMYIRGNLPTGVSGDTTSGGAGVAKGLFDGIDIDWEFPASPNGHLGNHWSVNDSANYVSLLSEFRSQLNTQGSADGKHYYLTAAVPSGAEAISESSAAQIQPYLDWAGIMSYDMHGSWEGNGPTDFQAPLYPSLTDPHASDHLSVDEAAKRWVNAGWPANKLVIGVPFYWRGWSGVPNSNNGLYQSATGPSPAYSITNQPGVANYKELLAAGKFKSTTLFYDSVTKSPWLYDNGNFYTGDTADTLISKGSYIRNNGYLGAMVYSLEGDDTSGSLMKAVSKGLSGGAPNPVPSVPAVIALARTSPSSPNTAKNGEPINMVGGNFLQSHDELKLPNKDNPVDFSLSYNSASASILDLNGWGWTNSYRMTALPDTDGSIVVQNADGRTDRFTSNANGGYTAPQGILDSLALVNNQFIVTHKDRSVYTFNTKGLISAITSRNGNTQTLSYDANDMLTTITDSANRSLSLSYNDNKLLSKVSDPSGRTVEYTYDTFDNLTSIKNAAGQITTYAYDTSHRLTKITDPRGHDVVVNVYDDQGRVTQQTNGLGNTVTLAYAPNQTTFTDANGGTTVYTYDAQFRVTNVKDAAGGNTATTYDTAGNVFQTTDPLGHTTSRLYDARGNLTQVTDPIGGIQKFTYDTQDNLLTRTDQLNHTTTYAYDTKGNPTQKTDAAGNITKFTYDVNGQTTAVTDPLNNLTGFVYDAAGNRVTKTDASNRNTYYGYDGIGRLTALGDADNDTAYYAYDATDHMTVVTDPNGHDTTMAYDADGNKTNVTDANGHATTYTYDANNNLTQVTNALNQSTNYTYDKNNNLVKTVDAKNNAKVYVYDLLNRQTQTTDPLGNIAKLTYDAGGNVLTRTDASNRTTSYTYDYLNRLTKVTYPDATTMAYTYDAADNLLTAIDSVGTTTYTYDNLNHVATVTDPHNATLTYTYNTADELTQVKYPDGKLVSYTYTPAKQLSTATDWNNATTTYAYDENGRLATKTLPNTIKGTYYYDANGNLSDLIYTKGANKFTEYNYVRDALGNVTEDDELTAGGTEYYSAYTYDANNQITQDDAPSHTWNYTYDAVGNMATSVTDGTTTNYAYNTASQMTSRGSRTFTYDKQGNQITDNTKTLGYNYDNLLKSYTSGTATTNFAYDATGNRVEKNGATSYQYVNGGNNNVMVSKNVTAGTSTFNLYGSDLISQGGAASTSRQYYLTDGLGNVKYLTSSTGATLNRYSYDPFGGNQTNSGTTANNYTYQAEQKDTESNLIYLRARYYDQTTGRFTSADPSTGSLGSPITQNGYNYANNNPVNFYDPTGMSAWSTFQSITGLDKYQNAIAGNCGWGSIATTGVNATLNLAAIGGAVVATGGWATGAIAGSAAVGASSVGVTAAATTLSEQLAMEEAVGVAGQTILGVNKMIIPAEKIGDPLLQGYEKWQYEHVSLDGTKTIVHYMYDSATKAVTQVKIK